MEVIAFYAFALLAIVASLLVVGQRNPMHSVMLLIASFGALAGLYVLLDAPFTAVTQIIIYAGAIMVLFLFVVMLLNVPREEPAPAGDCRRARADGAEDWRGAVGAAGRRNGLGAVAASGSAGSRRTRRRLRSARWRGSARGCSRRTASRSRSRRPPS